MSIIEKALDKSESKSPAPRDRAPVENRRDDQRASESSIDATSSPQPSLTEHAPWTDTRDADGAFHAEPAEHSVPVLEQSVGGSVEAAPKPEKRRPEFPRKTLKHVSLDFERLNAAGIIVPGGENNVLVEQFRNIKRPLLGHAAPGGINRVPNGNLVLVTSAIPNEGKTYTAVNLAMSIASELDYRVLLIDADPDKSDVSKLLGIHESEGLMDYVAQPTRPLSELLVKTDIDKLTVLPCGQSRANNTELFASEDMSRLADELAGRYEDRIVIVDSSPLLATSGARVLSQLAGQTVMVVEAIRTPQSAIIEALELLKSIQNVGLVLNKSRDAGGSGFQYGPYGGYGSSNP